MFGLTFSLELGEFVGGEDAGGRDGDLLVGTVGCGGDVFDAADEGAVVDDSAEHDVLPIEMRGGDANIMKANVSRWSVVSFAFSSRPDECKNVPCFLPLT